MTLKGMKRTATGEADISRLIDYSIKTYERTLKRQQQE